MEKILTPTEFASIRLSTKNYATNVTLPVYDRNIFAEVCHTGSVTLVVLSLIEATTEYSIPIYIGTNSRLDLVKSTSTCVAYEAKSIYIHSNYSALLPCSQFMVFHGRSRGGSTDNSGDKIRLSCVTYSPRMAESSVGLTLRACPTRRLLQLLTGGQGLEQGLPACQPSTDYSLFHRPKYTVPKH